MFQEDISKHDAVLHRLPLCKYCNQSYDSEASLSKHLYQFRRQQSKVVSHSQEKCLTCLEAMIEVIELSHDKQMETSKILVAVQSREEGSTITLMEIEHILKMNNCFVSNGFDVWSVDAQSRKKVIETVHCVKCIKTHKRAPDLIAEAMWSEKARRGRLGWLSTKDILLAINEKHPDLRLEDYGWKRDVMQTLSNDPRFAVKRMNGKVNFWCMATSESLP